MQRITITRARGGFIVEENDDEDLTVTTRLADALARAASFLSDESYGASVIGDVIVLTPEAPREMKK